MSLGSISRSPGGTVDFTLPSGTQCAGNGITTTPPNELDRHPRRLCDGSGHQLGNRSAAGYITAYSAYTGGNLGTHEFQQHSERLADRHADRHHFCQVVQHTEPGRHATGVTMSGPGSLTLAGGGLIGNMPPARSAAAPWRVVRAAGLGELIVITPQNLTIGSIIANNGGTTALTKAGSATLTLTGSNTYSGADHDRRRHAPGQRHRRLGHRGHGD